jgi:hypothetical protein
MTRVQKALLVLAGLAALTFAAVWPVSGMVSQGAVLAQRIIPQAGDLFGDGGPGTPVGSPQVFIIRDPKAFIEGELNGAKLLNETYLQENKIYPLQLKTVTFARDVTALVSGLGLILLLGLLQFMRGRR